MVILLLPKCLSGFTILSNVCSTLAEDLKYLLSTNNVVSPRMLSRGNIFGGRGGEFAYLIIICKMHSKDDSFYFKILSLACEMEAATLFCAGILASGTKENKHQYQLR